MLDPSILVASDDRGIDGLNYYWKNRAKYQISVEELAAVGITDGRTFIHPDLVKPLLEVQRRLKPHGYTIHIEDGYRSEATYELVYRKLAILKGQAFVDSRFSMHDMPHASGRAVDLKLIDTHSGLQARLHDDLDVPEAAFVGFYRMRSDPKSVEFQHIQDLLHGFTLDAGFQFGSKLECWHFEYPE